MIRTFHREETEALFRQQRVRRWAQVERQALRKLVQLDLAKSLDDMCRRPAIASKP